MNTATRRLLAFGTGFLALTLAPLSSGCSSGFKGTSASYAIIDSIQAASGASPDKLSGVLASDVETKGGIMEDPGVVGFRLALKDPGTAASPTTPSTTNFITFTRYHVNYIRSDGRNTQGVDVPYAFDGAMSVTVRDIAVSGTFTLVRVQSKLEAPLKALVGLGGAIVISTIAEVTFYGEDQAGRAVSVTGRISVNFADWADPT